jgi:hypothetical protein
MPTASDRDPSAVSSEAEVRHPLPATTQRQGGFSRRQAAMIAGVAYLVQYVTSVYPEFFVRPALIVAGDAARTASNIAAHAQMFRIAIVSDLLAGVAVVVLNAALYELLAPVHRGLARFAAFWRLVEVSVGSAIAVSGFIVLSLLSGAEPLQAFEARELQGLVHVVISARESGYMILLLFFGIGSTTYMYLLVRSRYVPMTLALLGLVGSALAALFALTRMLFPSFIDAAFTAVRGLPPVALVLIGLVLAPILLFELAFGFWLLFKGVRTAPSIAGIGAIEAA